MNTYSANVVEPNYISGFEYNTQDHSAPIQDSSRVRYRFFGGHTTISTMPEVVSADSILKIDAELKQRLRTVLLDSQKVVSGLHDVRLVVPPTGTISLQRSAEPRGVSDQSVHNRPVGTQVLNQTETVDPNLIRYSEIGGVLSTVQWQNRIFYLHQDLHLSIRYEDGFWFHEYDDLGIFSHGESVAESLQNFQVQFDAAWTYYAMEHDERLTVDAQELKVKLHALVREVAEAE